MARLHSIFVPFAAVAVALASLVSPADAARYRPPGGPHALYHGGDNQAQYPALTSTAVEEGVPSPLAIRLTVRSFPNPARGAARFRALAGAGDEIRVRLYSVTGRLVREWRKTGAGSSGVEWSWDALDASGRAAPPGLYFYRAEAGNQRAQGRLVLLGR